MKNKITYLLLLLFIISSIPAQQLQLNLVKGNCCLFNGQVFCYGLNTQKSYARFCIYKLDTQLNIKDSLVTDLGKTHSENYLNITADTLHNYLNIYLQEKEKKAVTILRFNKKFERIAVIEDVDIARLNNTAQFNSEALYFKNYVYTIKVNNDTSGKQFYLNKYELRSELKNFDYAFSWQFPFEKKNIHAAHIFYATKNYVLVYVYVDSGPKTGQWVLKINAVSGKLVRGTKLNSKGETATYLFGNFMADSVSGSVHLLGQKLQEAQFNQKENKLAISNAAQALVYLSSIDSTGEIFQKQEFKIPITTTVSGTKKTVSNYLLRVNSIKQNKEGKISFETDIYKNSDNSLCYLYANTTGFHLMPADEKMMLEKAVIAANPLIEKYYFTTDKLDMNGKLYIDSLGQFETIFYKPVTFPVKQAFKTTADNTLAFILTKVSPKKNTVNYTFLTPVKNNYQLTLIDEIAKVANPVFISITGNSFLIATQAEESVYRLKLFGW